HSVLYDDNFDIVCVAESWLNSNITNGILDPRGLFNIYRAERSIDQRGGGVCIFVKRNLNSAAIDFSVDENYGNVVIVQIILSPCCIISILCCYIVPDCPNNFFIQLFTDLSNISSQLSSFVMVGDFNLPNIDWENNFF